MPRLPTYFRVLLVVMALIHLARVAAYMAFHLGQAHGLVFADGHNPVGGDFLNQFAAGRLVLTGQVDAVYASARFGEFERSIVGPFSGVPLWVYPPPSLLLVWLFGLLGYFPALTTWSVLGLIALVIGAWRMGFRWIEVLILLITPATISCLVIGQTSNVFLGLLLVALSTRDGPRWRGGIAAGLLTLKPQLGFALPLIFLLRHQWRTMLVAIVVAVALAGASAAIFGFDLWRTYLSDTLDVLSAGERDGTGSFMLLEPSVFTAGRILTGDTGVSMLVHGIVAALCVAYAVWRQIAARTPDQQAAVALAATGLITPYFHSYDGGLLICAALLAAQQWEAAGGLARLLSYFVVVAAWLLPDVTQTLNGVSVPVGPVIMIAVLLLAGETPPRNRQAAVTPAAAGNVLPH